MKFMAKDRLSMRMRQVLLLGAMVVLWLLSMVSAYGIMNWCIKSDQNKNQNDVFLPNGPSPTDKFNPADSTIVTVDGQPRLIGQFTLSLSAISIKNPREAIFQYFNQALAEVSTDPAKDGSPEVSVYSSRPFFLYEAYWPKKREFLFMSFIIYPKAIRVTSYMGTGDVSPDDELEFQTLTGKMISWD
jgi:hypothetical protein